MNKEEYMRLAIRLAKKARGRTSPNPLVGALVVKEGEVVGKGFHQKAGEPHAEINAINNAGGKARGGELYINLEPCNHYGRTPPCTKTIIDSGIKRVFVGMEDPNEVVAGSGIQCLKDNGIYVQTGILREECQRLNETYIKYITEKRPFVILKSAASLDGKIATRVGDTRWITNEKSRAFLHRLRNDVDGILVGIGTIMADDPELTTRLNGRRGKDPVRIVVDSKLRIMLRAKVLNPESKAGTIIATTELAHKEKIKKLEELGARVLIVGSKENRVDLRELMYELGKLEITSLLIEGGAEINASSLGSGIVDKVLFFYAPKIIGGADALGMVGGEGVEKLHDAINLKNIRVRRLGDDILVEGYINKGKRSATSDQPSA
ncbi:MAG: riboflavin biosynthesis protein RibD [Deltaproteobacteria bacterium CG12_big_fil_rev_8_21_14_0_65_43_10]|nr:MAG: riboflavin biosynthesis protein RibD [Deltaproteobacteria bacterium CG12_big_fil_rev_8_21_14_0_65_43_10]PIU86770.1 MAG: riboflavin biosynthesis protein RibD [Deltaproteobacteria bacterium CG06_land_8_20_14_3_00_44_19]PIX22580.1 MAG: riboflavin biosynthesis protein RibD [Deltaproteobacteria bacterium CG_4_8_14_3_um_filter_43_13]PIZ21324.1 MAG: riboflavin biosynthesis protein RibD [Deltaproteobacteria bacterium CG_4_10_14_0_8_um_filter_43_12]PJB40902.1 MAG: riboflavin biosynthesis protein